MGVILLLSPQINTAQRLLEKGKEAPNPEPERHRARVALTAHRVQAAALVHRAQPSGATRSPGSTPLKGPLVHGVEGGRDPALETLGAMPILGDPGAHEMGVPSRNGDPREHNCPRTGEPGGLPSMGLHRVGHD